MDLKIKSIVGENGMENSTIVYLENLNNNYDYDFPAIFMTDSDNLFRPL